MLKMVGSMYLALNLKHTWGTYKNVCKYTEWEQKGKN